MVPTRLAARLSARGCQSLSARRLPDMRNRRLWCKQGVRTGNPHGTGKPHEDPGKDDYLLRYQVGITLIGCSAQSAVPQGQGSGRANPRRGLQVGERRQKAFLSVVIRL